MQDKLVAEAVFHPYDQVAQLFVSHQAWLDALVDQDMAQLFGNLPPGDEKGGCFHLVTGVGQLLGYLKSNIEVFFLLCVF